MFQFSWHQSQSFLWQSQSPGLVYRFRLPGHLHSLGHNPHMTMNNNILGTKVAPKSVAAQDNISLAHTMRIQFKTHQSGPVLMIIDHMLILYSCPLLVIPCCKLPVPLLLIVPESDCNSTQHPFPQLKSFH